MTCCVPNCNTSYRNVNTRKITMFTPNTERRLREWKEILQREVGLDKLKKTDKICILHFKEDVIERDRTVYVNGGKCYKELRKRAILSDNANPSLFEETRDKKKRSKKTKLIYCRTISPEILAQQRQMFLEKLQSVDKIESEDDEEVKLPEKQKIITVDDVAARDVESMKQKEINQLYEQIINAVNNNEVVSEYFNKLWIPNVHDNGCVSWTLWKEDCSGFYKHVVLHKDLKVDVYINGISICVPEMTISITKMWEFENLIREVIKLEN